jgi:hypothetical protein
VAVAFAAVAAVRDAAGDEHHAQAATIHEIGVRMARTYQAAYQAVVCGAARRRAATS